jgi:hypothetical protein
MKEHSMSALLICEKYIVVSVNGVPKEVSEIYSGDSDNNPRSVYSSGPEPGETIFTTSGIFTVPKGVKSIDVFCVGGGGQSIFMFGSGGGGYTNTILNHPVEEGEQISVTVGNGGVNGESQYYAGIYRSGGTSIVNNILVSVGGYAPSLGTGGYAFGYYANGQYSFQFYASGNGGNGGSGGGGYMPNISSSDGGSGATLFGGKDGGNGSSLSYGGTVNAIGGTGQGTTTRYFGESDGTLYSTGGTTCKGYGTSISGAANTGDGASAGFANNPGVGGSGVAIIRWGKK